MEEAMLAREEQVSTAIGNAVAAPHVYPSTHYIRRVPVWTIHKLTLLQLVCLIVLAVVEVTPLGILFSLFLVLLVPVRFLAGCFFY